MHPRLLLTEIAAITPQWRRRLCAAAALWLLACLLAFAPARVAARLFQLAVPQLELGALSGSFWQGSAGQAYVMIGKQRLALGRLDWQLQGWSLLWLHPSAHISAVWGEQLLDTTLRIGPTGRLTLRETRAVFPVTLARLWLPLPARGEIGLRLQTASLSRQGLQELTGEINWQRAQWQWGERWLALGDYQLQLHTEGASTLLGALDGKGDLAGSGKVTIDLAQRHYLVDAKLSASRGLPQEFRDSLVFLLGAKLQENTAPSTASSTTGSGVPLPLVLQRSGNF